MRFFKPQRYVALHALLSMIISSWTSFKTYRLTATTFLKVLREGNPPAKLYCVGDDWQSIYRFSGSDMALFQSILLNTLEQQR